MNELKVEVRQTRGEIACNFDEIEVALRNQMQAYEELQVTEDNLKERKADVTTLRKIKGAVDDERKRVKAEFSEPLVEFEGRVKKLTGIIDDQINRINADLNKFEQMRIDEKRIHVKELYDREIGDLADYLPYDVIRSSRWDNKTVSDNEIISEIQTAKLKVRGDVNAIKALNSDIEDRLLEVYRASGNNLSVAIQKNTDYLSAKKAAEEAVERKAKEEAERKEREAAQAKSEAPAPIVTDVSTVRVTSAEEPTLIIRVTGEENIKAVLDFLHFSEVGYEEIKAGEWEGC